MTTYLMMYCVYDPDCYLGYKIKEVQAESAEEAEAKGHQLLEGLLGKGNWVYIITEKKQASYRVYNTLQHKRL